MLTEANYFTRSGPENPVSPIEGAFEDGKRLSVIGRKLMPGVELPNFMFRYRHNRSGVIIWDQESEADKETDSVIITAINELNSSVCFPQTLNCLLNLGSLPSFARQLILTNEPLNVVSQFLLNHNHNNEAPIFSTDMTDTGIRLGNQLTRGDLQRSQIAAVRQLDGKWVVVDAQYIYDQGNPLPNDERTMRAVMEARAESPINV